MYEYVCVCVYIYTYTYVYLRVRVDVFIEYLRQQELTQMYYTSTKTYISHT